MAIIIYKLKALKLALKVWNREVFDNLDCNIEAASTAFIDVQKWYNDDLFSNKLLQLGSDARVDLDVLLHQQDTFFREKIRIKWHKGGDRKTTFLSLSFGF